MPAEILLGGIVSATVSGWEWECEDEVILECLRSITPELGPGGEMANPDRWLALHACKVLGGELIWSDPTISVPGSVH